MIVTMNPIHVLVIVAMAVVSLMAATSGQRCYSRDPNPYRYFAAKTRYDDSIKGQPPLMNSTAAGCTPRLFYLLARHGSRFPSKTDYNNMLEYLPDLQARITQAGNTSFCPEDLAKLTSWTQRIGEEDVDDLAETGVREMEDIARKYQNIFPGLLKVPYAKDKFHFQPSYMERNILSAKAFAKGLFNNEEAEIINNPKGHDPLLQFYKNCKKTQETMKKPMPERRKFIEGHLTRVTIPAIEQFLGFSSGTLLYEQVDAMYKMCVFDHVVYNDAPWCAVFSTDDLVALEYDADLWNYYLEGPGYQIYIDQSCELLKDVAAYLRMPSKYSPGGYPVGVFRFTHSPVLNSFLAQLGLFHGQTHLRGDNMDDLADRKWRLSLLDPYSGHVAFVVEECANSKFELHTFINEKRYSSGQNGDLVLDWKAVIDAIGPTADMCDFDTVCENHGSSINCGHIHLVIVVLFYFLLQCM